MQQDNLMNFLYVQKQPPEHGSTPTPPHPRHQFYEGDLKLSDQNNWGGAPEQKTKFRGVLNLREDLKF